MAWILGALTGFWFDIVCTDEALIAKYESVAAEKRTALQGDLSPLVRRYTEAELYNIEGLIRDAKARLAAAKEE